MRRLVIGCLACGLFSGISALGQDMAGGDVREAFVRAREGQPLRVVALGGSITQAGGGWIASWLRRQFPKSDVVMINSGMSGTGSSLGVFRLERDVIAHQPDLVMIEFCVNDSGMDDDTTVRFMETLIVRLKKLPHPPAIVIIEAAEKGGVNLKRHRRVAQHYSLVEVDLQKAVDDYLKQQNMPWEKLFSDNVHPNDEGHRVYASAIEKVLATLMAGRTNSPAESGLPSVLSAKPLLLDATMVALGPAAGWEQKPQVNSWWGRFFFGSIRSQEPSAALRLPFRGMAFGVLFVMNEKHGAFYASVDDALPGLISTNHHDGYGYNIIDIDLPAREHIVSLAVPPVDGGAPVFSYAGPVELGYLLVAGHTQATREPSPPGDLMPETIQAFRFSPIGTSHWSWAGPYVENGTEARDASDLMNVSFPPEAEGKDELRWQGMPGASEGWTNLRSIAGTNLPAVVYLRTQIEAGGSEPAILALAADYFAKVWLNGKEVSFFRLDGRPAQSPSFGRVTLRKGENELLLKIGSGSAGFGFSFYVGAMKSPR